MLYKLTPFMYGYVQFLRNIKIYKSIFQKNKKHNLMMQI